jgi:hypothetical protein
MYALQARSVTRTDCYALPYVMTCTLDKLHAACVVDPRCPAGMDRTILETEILRLPDWGLLISDRESISPRELFRPASTRGEFDGSTPAHTHTHTHTQTHVGDDARTLFIDFCASSTNSPPLPFTTLCSRNNEEAESRSPRVLQASDGPVGLLQLAKSMQGRSASHCPVRHISILVLFRW